MIKWSIDVYLNSLENNKNCYDFVESVISCEDDLHDTIQEKLISYYDIMYTLKDLFYVPNEKKVYIFLEEF